MGKCIVLVGPMASGKTTLARFMGLYGWRRIVTYTTRPPREGEVDGIDYWFVTDDEFKALIRENMLAEWTEYNAKFGHCYYGSTKSSYHNTDNTVIVLNPDGVLALTEPAFIAWLDLPEDVLLKRLERRGDPMDEIKRRMADDAVHFRKMGAARVCDMRITEEMLIEKLSAQIIYTATSQDLHSI